jgi:hypothetical protein
MSAHVNLGNSPARMQNAYYDEKEDDVDGSVASAWHEAL